MEFNGQYLTYLEYKALGGTLPETSFNLLEFEARKQIDLRTQNRLKTIDEVPSEVKLCDFHLINKIEKYTENEDSVSGTLSSENTDGYSVSFLAVQDVIKNKNADLQETMMSDLYGVIVDNEHIIYNGVK